MKLNLLNRLTICRRNGHLFEVESMSLGGYWVRCTVCRKLDEWLPGVHEPRGKLATYTLDPTTVIGRKK